MAIRAAYGRHKEIRFEIITAADHMKVQGFGAAGKK
jgi:hypothetical protein